MRTIGLIVFVACALAPAPGHAEEVTFPEERCTVTWLLRDKTHVRAAEITCAEEPTTKITGHIFQYDGTGVSWPNDKWWLAKLNDPVLCPAAKLTVGDSRQLTPFEVSMRYGVCEIEPTTTGAGDKK